MAGRNRQDSHKATSVKAARSGGSVPNPRRSSGTRHSLMLGAYKLLSVGCFLAAAFLLMKAVPATLTPIISAAFTSQSQFAAPYQLSLEDFLPMLPAVGLVVLSLAFAALGKPQRKTRRGRG